MAKPSWTILEVLAPSETPRRATLESQCRPRSWQDLAEQVTHHSANSPARGSRENAAISLSCNWVEDILWPLPAKVLSPFAVLHSIGLKRESRAGRRFSSRRVAYLALGESVLDRAASRPKHRLQTCMSRVLQALCSCWHRTAASQTRNLFLDRGRAGQADCGRIWPPLR